MFLTDVDNQIVRFGSEIMFANQMIAQMEKEKQELVAVNGALNKQVAELQSKLDEINMDKFEPEVKGQTNGYVATGLTPADTARRQEEQGVFRQRGSVDNWSGPHSRSGAAEATEGDGDIRYTD